MDINFLKRKQNTFENAAATHVIDAFGFHFHSDSDDSGIHPNEDNDNSPKSIRSRPTVLIRPRPDPGRAQFEAGSSAKLRHISGGSGSHRSAASSYVNVTPTRFEARPFSPPNVSLVPLQHAVR